MVTRCNNPKCISTFQDAKYGKSMRVHNYALKANAGVSGHRCTVCSKIADKRVRYAVVEELV